MNEQKQQIIELKRAIDKLYDSKESIQKRKKQDIPIALILQRIEDLGRLLTKNTREDEIKEAVLNLIESTLQKERIFSFSSIENDDPLKGMISESMSGFQFDEENIISIFIHKNIFFEEHLSRIRKYVNINTEHGNRMIIDTFLLEVVDQNPNLTIFPEYQVSIQLENGNLLKGPIDYIVGETNDDEILRRRGAAKPNPKNEVVIVEAKSDPMYENTYSIYQLKAEMLAVHTKRMHQKTRGCLTSGKNWTFVLLDKSKFYFSEDISWENKLLLPILRYWFNDFENKRYKKV